VNVIRFPFWILLAALVGCCGGCHTKTPNPLIGFNFSSLNILNSNTAITDDYKNYIQTLSPDERKSAGPILYFEDESGQHAVEIMIGLNGTVWEHVLIYDKDNKRIKTIKYSNGGYRS